MKHIILVAVAALFFLAGCSKDQAVVRQLDGEWKVSSMTYNGVPASADDYAGTTFTFEKCKVSKEDCSGQIRFVDSGQTMTIPFTYSISDKGEKMTMKYVVFGFTYVETATILEHSKSTFKFSVLDEDGDTTVTTLTKI